MILYVLACVASAAADQSLEDRARDWLGKNNPKAEIVYLHCSRTECQATVATSCWTIHYSLVCRSQCWLRQETPVVFPTCGDNNCPDGE